jgi:type IV secretory pathway VirB9-like protein
MKRLKTLIGGVCACLIASAQVPEVRPQVAGRAVQEGQVTTVYLAPRFVTAIRMPDAVNSVVLGDPDAFSAEHSEREPQIVFVKPITAKASQTNLLISTAHGYQANLLLISRGESPATQPGCRFHDAIPPGRQVRHRAKHTLRFGWPDGGVAGV